MNTVIFSFKKYVIRPEHTDKNKRLELCTYECIAGNKYKLFKVQENENVLFALLHAMPFHDVMKN